MARPWADKALMVGGGAAAEPSTIPALTDGQLAIGKTGYAPVPGTITGGGGVVVTGGAGTLALTTRGFVSTTPIGNVLGGEDDLQSWSVPANTLVAHSGLQIGSVFAFAGNANTKAVKMYVGGSSFALNPTTTAPNNVIMVIDLWLWYTSSTTALVTGFVFFGAGIEQFVLQFPSTTIDWTTTTVIKFTGTATATNDIVQDNVALLAFRNPS